MRTWIIGAGALGGLIGARLAATGARVSFAVRDRASAERLRQAGFRVSGVGGPVTVAAPDVAALDEVPVRPEADLVVLAT
jgi:2-dehydropantoate 2-reductase